MSSLPLVSIIVASYNQEKFIGKAIESCLKQSYDNFEVIIADDASNDRTKKIIEDYATRYPKKIKFLNHQKNLGITKNVNTALRACCGKYVCLLGGDDLLIPDKLKIQVDILESHPEATICYHDVTVFADIGKRVLYKMSERFILKTCDLKYVLKHGVFFYPISCLIRRESLPEYGCDEDIPISSDWLMICECLIRGKGIMVYTPEVLALYRRHSQSLTHKKKDELILLELEVIDLMKKKYPHFLKELLYREAILNFMAFLKKIIAFDLKNGITFLKKSLRSNLPPLIYVALILKELKWRFLTSMKILFNGNKFDDC